MSSPRDHLLNRLRNALYFGLRYRWVRHGKNVHVKWSTRMWSPHRQIEIGSDVGIGFNCLFLADIRIGNKVLIASNVALVGSDDHRIDLVGTAMFDSGRVDSRSIVIEDDVWIGHGAVVIAGTRIGRGSIIGAGSVVVGDVEPYSILIPQKARVLRRRFSDQDAAAHDAALWPDVARLSR